MSAILEMGVTKAFPPNAVATPITAPPHPDARQCSPDAEQAQDQYNPQVQRDSTPTTPA